MTPRHHRSGCRNFSLNEDMLGQEDCPGACGGSLGQDIRHGLDQRLSGSDAVAMPGDHNFAQRVGQDSRIGLPAHAPGIMSVSSPEAADQGWCRQCFHYRLDRDARESWQRRWCSTPAWPRWGRSEGPWVLPTGLDQLTAPPGANGRALSASLERARSVSSGTPDDEDRVGVGAWPGWSLTHDFGATATLGGKGDTHRGLRGQFDHDAGSEACKQ